MPSSRIVPTSKARQDFAQTLKHVIEGHQRVILTSHGKSVAVVIPIEDFHVLERMEKGRCSMETILDAASKMVAVNDKVRTIILFGSYARGDARGDESDVDLMVVSDEVKDFWQEHFDLVSSVPDDVPAQILLTTTEIWQRRKTEKNSVYWNANREGKILWQKQ